MSYYRDQLEAWLKTIDVKADMVLDIGGAANPVRSRVKSWDVKTYQILDNGLENVSEPFIEFDLNSKTNTKYPPEADVIFCLEVFEYVYDPMTALKNIYDLMVNNGIAYISFPFVYPHHQPEFNDYLRYTEQGVRYLMGLSGFNTIDIKPRIDRSGKLEEFYRADGMHPVRTKPCNETGYLVKALRDES